jgi:hypothetical protein
MTMSNLDDLITKEITKIANLYDNIYGKTRRLPTRAFFEANVGTLMRKAGEETVKAVRPVEVTLDGDDPEFTVGQRVTVQAFEDKAAAFLNQKDRD